MGELEVFLSGAGLMPGGVAGTCRDEGGDPICMDQESYIMRAQIHMCQLAASLWYMCPTHWNNSCKRT